MLDLIDLSLSVNGSSVDLNADPRDSLLDVLRDRLGLTGTKRGCDEGACGACTVIMNGRLVNSCMILAAEVDGAEIVTIEGIGPLSETETLHPVQKAFIDSGAVQCGFCTPGMILSAIVLLESEPLPSRHRIREALSGNLCRCTGYEKIIDAVESAARRINGTSYAS